MKPRETRVVVSEDEEDLEEDERDSECERTMFEAHRDKLSGRDSDPEHHHHRYHHHHDNHMKRPHSEDMDDELKNGPCDMGTGKHSNIIYAISCVY